MATKYEEAQAEFLRRTKHFEAEMAAKGHPVRCTDFYRSKGQQAILYAQGRTAPGKKVTNAKPGESPHNFALARDYCFLTATGKVTYNGDWALLGRVAKLNKLVWGGRWLRFQDRPHVEFPMWRNFKA